MQRISVKSHSVLKYKFKYVSLHIYIRECLGNFRAFNNFLEFKMNL